MLPGPLFIGTGILSRVFTTDGTPRTVKRLAISTVVSTDVVVAIDADNVDGDSGIKPGVAVFLNPESCD